tara:strand:- start:291 stop:413 length:123 start_codon:yes stop_codon:yes gene_type:complete
VAVLFVHGLLALLLTTVPFMVVAVAVVAAGDGLVLLALRR